MIANKETATIRLEVEFQLLVGELRVLEDDILRMPLSKFLEVWGPEVIDSRIMLTLITAEEIKDGRNINTNRQGHKDPRQQELFPADDSEIHHR